MAISNINSLSLDPSGGFPASATATVATSQSTTSASYTDLATAGPAVTVTTGTKALVIVTSRMLNNLSTYNSYMGFAVSGASSVAASDDSAYWIANPSTTRASMVVLQTGLTAGSNIFTAKYKAEASSTAHYERRTITVIDMGS